MGLNNILISDNAGVVRSAFINNTPNKNTVTNLKVNSLPEATNLSFLFSNMYNLQEVNELNIPEAANIYRARRRYCSWASHTMAGISFSCAYPHFFRVWETVVYGRKMSFM